MQKLEQDYARDLVKGRFSSKAILTNYLKETGGGKLPENGENKDTNEDPDEPKEQEISVESTISMNPKLNIILAPGFAKQIEKNIKNFFADEVGEKTSSAASFTLYYNLKVSKILSKEKKGVLKHDTQKSSGEFLTTDAMSTLHA